MFGLSFWEIALVLVVALLVLGPQRMPKLLHDIGRGLRELRKASAGLREAIDEPLEELRKPLQDLRDEVADTVYRAEREVREAVQQAAAAEDPPGPSPYLDGDAAPPLAEPPAPAEQPALSRDEPVEREESRRAPLAPPPVLPDGEGRGGSST